MLIDRHDPSKYKHEYDVRVRRLADFLSHMSPVKEEMGSSLVEFEPGEKVREHVNRERVEEIFLLLDGTAEFFLDGKTETLHAGDLAFAPIGQSHSFTNTSEHTSRLLCVWWKVPVTEEEQV